MVRNGSKLCRVPLTVGGGIKNIDHIFELMHCGADKISINQSCIHQPKLLTKAARLFGEQCIVASIDALLVNNEYRVYDYLQQKVLP